MNGFPLSMLAMASAIAMPTVAAAQSSPARPAIDVIGHDVAFPRHVDGLPDRLSDFPGLRIGSFETSDGVTLTWWEAGSGSPLVFVPGWSANGAEYLNVLYLMAKTHRVIVLDQRNQGLSQKVTYGTRIARYSQDLRELLDHLAVTKADFCGWSMGASVIWSYIDLYGTVTIRRAAFVDEPISIVSRPDWSEAERRDAGSIATSPEQVIAMMAKPAPEHPDPNSRELNDRFKLRDAAPFANSEAFADAVVKNDPERMMLVMYDHASLDWRDVLKHRIDVPTAFFTGKWSRNVPSQRWAQAQIPGSRLYVYPKAQQGDHFLMFKNPFKFTADLNAFLAG